MRGYDHYSSMLHDLEICCELIQYHEDCIILHETGLVPQDEALIFNDYEALRYLRADRRALNAQLWLMEIQEELTWKLRKLSRRLKAWVTPAY